MGWMAEQLEEIRQADRKRRGAHVTVYGNGDRRPTWKDER